METTVVVGMSGGVDSSVTAALLKEQGYRVIGIFMKNWEELDENGVCRSAQDYEDVVKVCEKLDIPYYAIEFVKEYREGVFNHFVREYEQGYTPNPDILCNREIKFKVFLEKALALGADFLATGHYCQKFFLGGEYRLVKGLDPQKDQSYFLYTMTKEKLKDILFPIGHLEKSAVRTLARKWNLSTKDKKDSTGICFIGERNFKNFLSHYVPMSPGDFETLDGKKVGQHTGACYYTIGQRKGLGLGGPGEPWFVVGKNIERNVIIVERGERHPALYADELWCEELSWVDGELNENLPYNCFAKIRYRQADQRCSIVEQRNGKMRVTFPEPQKAVTPRQSIVFYQDLEGQRVCLGGGMIIDRGKSYYEMKKNLPQIVSV